MMHGPTNVKCIKADFKYMANSSLV